MRLKVKLLLLLLTFHFYGIFARLWLSRDDTLHRSRLYDSGSGNSNGSQANKLNQKGREQEMGEWEAYEWEIMWAATEI